MDKAPFEVDMIDPESDRLICQISFSRELLDYGSDEFSYGQEHFRDVLGEDYEQLDEQEILAALSNKVDYKGIRSMKILLIVTLVTAKQYQCSTNK